MEIHKPHAAKTWREFTVELATITAGILIALTLEQVIEWQHASHRAREARENIRVEIADNLGFMDVRQGIEQCISARLDEVLQMLQDSASGKPLPDPIWIGHPTDFSMRDSQFRSASQSGQTSLLPTAEQASYASIYASFAAYQEAQAIEQKAWADLRTIEQRPVVSPIVDWQLRSAIQQAKSARWQMEISRSLAMQASNAVSVLPAKYSPFTKFSACLPLRTSRAEALKFVVEGRPSRQSYDEP